MARNLNLITPIAALVNARMVSDSAMRIDGGTKLITKVLFIIALSCGLFFHPVHAARTGTGIVTSIVKAPVVADGDVAGAMTDIVINLDGAMRPSAPGRALLAGRKITVTLADDFINTLVPPVRTPFTASCRPPFLKCSTVMLLQGWPQHPVGYPPPAISGKWKVSQGHMPNVLEITALEDLIPDPPLEPGIKQIHLLLSGFINPKPGHYTVKVAAQTGRNGALETGSARVYIRPMPKPSINVSSAYHVGLRTPNTIFQQALPNQLTRLAYDLLLWDRFGLPMHGVTIKGSRLVRNTEKYKNRTVGHISIIAPDGAVGQQVFSTAPSSLTRVGLTGVSAARLRVKFRAGSIPGTYIVRLRLVGGNTIEMFVIVPSSGSLVVRETNQLEPTSSLGSLR